jgi:hypothetical protein
MFEPNISTPNYIKKTLLDSKAQIDSDTVILRDFNSTLLPLDRSPRQKNQQ